MCGTLLIEAKLWTEHGEWLPLLARVGIAARTAQRFMRLADKFKCAELGAFASVEAAERALLPAPAPPAEYRPTGPEVDIEAAVALVHPLIDAGVDWDDAVRLGMTTMHAKLTGRLPSDRWMAYHHCDHCDCERPFQRDADWCELCPVRVAGGNPDRCELLGDVRK